MKGILTMNKKHTHLWLLLALVALLAAACTPQATDPTPVTAEQLSGEWTLTEINGSAPMAGSTITLTMENGEVSGTGGCNSYGGQVLLEGMQLSFSELYATEMFCMEPEGIMDQETTYHQTLSQIASFEIVDGSLALKNADGETTLLFAQ